ncbi:MAG: HAMP domain-containing histidine kinase [Acidobacteria bacterium]|nr:HAMP domain-containing histidine kinase [Acidobacteriota bacterium]
MFSKGSTRPPRSLVALIVGITVVPLATLLWLGWRLLEQDRALEQQQVRQRVERGADLVVSALQRAVSVSEQRLAAGSGPGADGAVAVTFRDGHVEASPHERLAYFPVVQPLPEASATTFARGEDLEFHQHDRAAAITSFRELARSSDSAIRAGALLRLGRNLHNVGRFEEAFAAYGRLSEMDGVSVGSVPAGLIGRYARCKLLQEQRQWPNLRAEALGLQRELWSGRWTLTGPVYSLYATDAAKWTGGESLGARQPEVFAEAVSVLWDRWMLSRPPARASSGRESLSVNRQPLSVLWQNSDGSFRALVAAPAFVESQWLRALAPIAKEQNISFGLRDTDEARVFGTVGTDGPKTVRGAAESALPWSVVTASLDPPVERYDFARRRLWLAAGFVLLVAMALVASYLIVRAVKREMAVARLQSDFVAAVSHEFRTPLTALRQFTDMLREHPALDDDRRRTAYDAQSRATDRLTRLVESLLDFGRMEAGARRYRFEPRDGAELVRRVVHDFRADALAAGYDIEFRGNGSAPIDTDDEALARAVWNLLDNAVKYSTTPSHVEVDLHNRDGQVFIAVRDHGIGIPAHEQAEVFSKFYRGEQARIRGIKGTGIGLAMVDDIVKAHHGHVEVESEPGKGSTFTIVLPAVLARPK